MQILTKRQTSDEAKHNYLLKES